MLLIKKYDKVRLKKSLANNTYKEEELMRIAIVYKGLTGNTKLVAENIKKALKEDIIYCGEPKDNLNAELYFIGSWTDKGMCCSEIAEFIKKLENKKIAYFGTAGFGGSREYYETLFSRVKSIIPASNEVVGNFYCQGKMPIRVRERYVALITEHLEDKQLEVSIKNFDEALSHPDQDDLENIKKWAYSIVSTL